MHPLLFFSKPCPVRLPRHTRLTIGRGVQGGASLRGFWGGASLSCINMIGKGELLITIMSSLTQEESRSISENVTWGHRKRFADGKVCVPYRHFLGYDKGPDGNLAVNKEKARTVKLIYRLFLDGYTFRYKKKPTFASLPEVPGRVYLPIPMASFQSSKRLLLSSTDCSAGKKKSDSRRSRCWHPSTA
jgi:hypothetical protein